MSLITDTTKGTLKKKSPISAHTFSSIKKLQWMNVEQLVIIIYLFCCLNPKQPSYKKFAG